jgi:hypothetical protein
MNRAPKPRDNPHESEREETTPTQIQNQSLGPKPFPQTLVANQKHKVCVGW